MNSNRSRQSGASLIEVLIAILILSFGMLSLSGMMAYAIQAPKLAAYRATAAAQASAYIERMRANKAGFQLGYYQNDSSEPLSYNVTTPASYLVTQCQYPNCTAQSIATFDLAESLQKLRSDLTSKSGMRVICNVTCASNSGDLWIMWDEPSQMQGINFSSNDECPDSTVTPAYTLSGTPPRCLHMKFTL